MAKKVKLLTDTNKRAKAIVDIATGENPAPEIDPYKSCCAGFRAQGRSEGWKSESQSINRKTAQGNS